MDGGKRMIDHPSMVCAVMDPTSIEAPVLEQEITGIDLGDARRDRRACAVIEQLGRQPGNSIPSAIGGWSETRSAYNLLAHDQATAQKISNSQCE
jgi:hypothetical protein